MINVDRYFAAYNWKHVSGSQSLYESKYEAGHIFAHIGSGERYGGMYLSDCDTLIFVV